jgi:hypothetical protein
MVRALLVRGMLVGLLAGLLVFAFGRVFGEPPVDRAIGFEAALHEAEVKADLAKGLPAPMEEPELVSRAVQASFGLLTGVVVYATAFGGLFALVFAFAYGRVGRLSPRAVSALLAAGGIVALYIVPNLKYPANPPAIGEPGTIGIRTALYFLMLLISLSAAVGAVLLRQRLLARHGGWASSLIGGGVYLAIVIVAGAWVLPPVNEVPADFPADVLWNFRIASLGMQAVMWVTIGLVFGWLTERAMAPSDGRTDRPSRLPVGAVNR